MKRRANIWKRKNYSQESDEDESNSLNSGDENQENGDDSSTEQEPEEKRRRSTGTKDASSGIKKNVEKKMVGRGRKSRDKAADSEESADKEDSELDDEEEKSSKKGTKRGRRSKQSEPEEEENGNGNVSDDQIEVSKKGVGNKKAGRGRKSKDKPAEEESEDKTEEDDSEAEEAEYEVESIVDEKTIKGIRYYLIRWKGYGEESDTWEPASTLNCSDALREYKKNKGSEKSKKPPAKPKKTPEPIEEWDENEDFEVVRILDVHFKRDGKREFLVAWKGYSQKYDSWEPEENMNCKDLIGKFLKKCDQAKEANPKELRVDRKITDRFTLSTKDTGRRLSKRHQGKQRIHYHDAE